MVFITMGIVGAVVFRYLPSPDSSTDTGTATRTLANFSFKPPDTRWSRDASLQKVMNANYAIKRNTPFSRLVLVYTDYRSRPASNAELLEGALSRLRKYFKDVEYDDPFKQSEKNRGTLSGVPAVVMVFTGLQDEVNYAGQVYLLTHRGYAYWLFTWGPADQRDELTELWDDVRKGFVLANERENWKPRPRESELSEGSNFSFQVNHVKEVWKRDEHEKYEKADLVLGGYEPTVDEETGRKTMIEYSGKRATVQFLVLPSAPDLKAANQAAIDFILEEQKKINATATFEPIPDPKTGKPLQDGPAKIGQFDGYLSKLQLSTGGENDRYVILGIVPGPKGTLAIFCECLWTRRDYWEQEFKELLANVRPDAGTGKKPPVKKESKEKPEAEPKKDSSD
jgi:hypothetical protein